MLAILADREGVPLIGTFLLFVHETNSPLPLILTRFLFFRFYEMPTNKALVSDFCYSYFHQKGNHVMNRTNILKPPSSSQFAQLFKNHLKVVIQRFISALSNHHYDQVLIHAGSLKTQFQDDLQYSFSVNPHFKTWAPLTEHPECCLLFSLGKKPIIFYYQPTDFWHSVPEDPIGYWVDEFDVVVFKTPSERDQQLTKRITQHCVFLGEEDTWAKSLNINAINPFSFTAYIQEARTRKTDYEIECLKYANQIALIGHQRAIETFKNGASELDVHLEYLKTIKAREEQLPYPNIVCQNTHCSILHYHTYRTEIPQEGLKTLLLDGGAQYNGYAADITRSTAYNETDTDCCSMIQRLEEEQQALIKSIKVGDSFIDLHEQMHIRVAKILREFGITHLDEEAQVELGITQYFFPHGLGHFLGLQVHDVAGKIADASGKAIEQPKKHPFLRLLRPLEVGNVFTIEPGIYFISVLLDQLKADVRLSRYMDWGAIEKFRVYGGFRIEDDLVLQLENQISNLSR